MVKKFANDSDPLNSINRIFGQMMNYRIKQYREWSKQKNYKEFSAQKPGRPYFSNSILCKCFELILWGKQLKIKVFLKTFKLFAWIVCFWLDNLYLCQRDLIHDTSTDTLIVTTRITSFLVKNSWHVLLGPPSIFF